MANFVPTLRTKRLILRPWEERDRPAFATLNADPRVMEFFPSRLSRLQSDSLLERIVSHFVEHGFGLWAIEIPGIIPFAGFVGLSAPHFQAHFTPTVEVGWRLAFDCWGRGYASEGARRAIAFGFEAVRLVEIVSFTSADNLRSRAVMERIGMRHNPRDDFDHPSLPKGHPLRRHVLFRLSGEQASAG